ncbi:MAG: OmpA family protein [Oleiphilaceae bacterium]|nr:OmpA family protein [Oleiphilaceae bacterium]
MAQLDDSQWYVSASIFECSIVQDIPRYGQGIFYHEAGEDLIFYAQARNNPMKPGKAALVVEASPWKAGQVVQDLGYVPVLEGARAVTTNHTQATAMLYGLLDGMSPAFTRRAWYKDESIRVALNSINFSPAYEQYLDCVASLLPVNFRQMERSRIHFKVDKAELTDDDYERLDLVILYALADSTVTAVYVDGHTDNSGRRIYNRRLSKARAEAVTNYLIQGGIAPEIIQTRYHGERYPIVKNNSPANKAKNRRTTVRLVRGDGSATFSDGAPED